MGNKKTVLAPSSVTVPATARMSLGIRSGNVVFVGGQVALDESGQLVGKGDIKQQTTQVLKNIKGILEEGGCSLADVAKTTVYLVDFADYQGMNEIYSRYFPDAPPARATIRADLVNPDFLVEIDAFAVTD